MRAVHINGAEELQHPDARRPWGGSQVWLVTRALTGSALSLTRMILAPGQSAEAHRHPNADEVIYLGTGRVDVRAGPTPFRSTPRTRSPFRAGCRIRSTIRGSWMPT